MFGRAPSQCFSRMQHVGYVFGPSTKGQSVVYQAGLTGIPITNVNNNCATGIYIVATSLIPTVCPTLSCLPRPLLPAPPSPARPVLSCLPRPLLPNPPFSYLGASALFASRNMIAGGLARCTLAVGVEKMQKGSLTLDVDDVNPIGRSLRLDGRLWWIVCLCRGSHYPVGEGVWSPWRCTHSTLDVCCSRAAAHEEVSPLTFDLCSS